MEPLLPALSLEEYWYDLPPESIARYPIPQRDQCRLLVADARDRQLHHHIFAELPTLLPKGSLLVRNVTQVVPVRLFLRKPTGGRLEILLLQPVEGSVEESYAAYPPVEWWGLVRGRGLRPGQEFTVVVGQRQLSVSLRAFDSGRAHLVLAWQPATETLAELLHAVGSIPIPPYLRREAEQIDREYYQTVYATLPGSVAAPTAGLHFTESLLDKLQQAGVAVADLCLHIGLDTFKPIQVTDVRSHRMHSESISVPRQTLEQVSSFLRSPERGWLVAVGTTSVRTLESLYWHGVRLLLGQQNVWESPTLQVGQWDAYGLLNMPLPPPLEVIDALLQWLDNHRLEQLKGATELMIMPGYRYQLCDALITNFHQPRSTLLLLVGAFVGDFWRHIYAEALAHGYRFLSYGDASLLINPRPSP